MASSMSVTDKCNLNCKHCYAVSKCDKKEQVNLEEAKSYVDQLSEMGCFSVQISGGEPMILPDILEIMDYVSSKGMAIYFITNGTMLNKGSLEKISRFNVKSFQISIDSMNPGHYQSIRGEDILETVKKNAKVASRILGNRFVVGTVMLRDNCGDYPNIFRFTESIDSKFTLIPLLTTGRGEFKKNDISIEEKVSSINEIFCMDTRGKFRPVVPMAFYPEERRQKRDMYPYCGFPLMAGIMANGDVYPCEGLRNIPELKMGNLKSEKLKKIWEKSRLIRKLNSIKARNLKGICSKCRHAEACGGGCRAAAYFEYGDFRMPDPFCQKAFDAGMFPKEALVRS